MDGIKAIDKKDSGAQFLSDKAIRTNPFGDNISGSRAYIRAEKIAAAMYLVTRHIADSEPARMRTRQAAAELLPAILAVRDEMRAPGSRALIQASASIRELISLVRLLSVGGHLSTSNAEVLVGALDDLGVLLSASPKTLLSESVTLTADVLADTKDADIRHARAPEHYKGHSNVSVKDVRKNTESASDKNHKGQRTDNILGVLRAKEKLGIKDIVSHLPEYSEKMIQRELKILVASGRVKKLGSKRWSTYLLV
ncbi:hypothetical protein A3B35_01355 [Candidatus Kaiserbacteria bacterium RIFCSPLOWO2_01_FULL_54_24]|uniref:HTH deoR-type domain-containing protein n=1 Tax=Candidatus Kaiserbacteria bacterium RIFCSPLOWO2_01_FULL_54_24 TaxID=1798515 RepID=A0A1F6EVJ4_9BACT|nr:MAG: hypothetical protein A3B35_01355 [Candidatus Kaiserbacteria bacterium RIFCSPLOWO2_01_FULL_54_24]